jgi:hypothetical protein
MPVNSMEDLLDRSDILPADTEIPAPAMTTIFFFLLKADKSLPRFSSSPSVGFSKSMYAVVRGPRGVATRRRLGGGGPSVRTQISPAESDISKGFRGDVLPDTPALELGEGYRLERSRSGLGGDGDCERTDNGEEGGDAGCGRNDAMVAIFGVF